MGRLALAFNSSPWETKPGGALWVSGQPVYKRSEYPGRQGQIVRPCGRRGIERNRERKETPSFFSLTHMYIWTSTLLPLLTIYSHGPDSVKTRCRKMFIFTFPFVQRFSIWQSNNNKNAEMWSSRLLMAIVTIAASRTNKRLDTVSVNICCCERLGKYPIASSTPANWFGSQRLSREDVPLDILLHLFF